MTIPQQMQSRIVDYMKLGQQTALQLATTMTGGDGSSPAGGGAGSGGAPGGLFPGAAEFLDQAAPGGTWRRGRTREASGTRLCRSALRSLPLKNR